MERVRFLSAMTAVSLSLHDRILHPELYRGTRYGERLSSRALDRAVRAPGCSRAVSKWISRSHECESTCIIASRACARGIFCVNARVIHPERVVGAVCTVAAVPDPPGLSRHYLPPYVDLWPPPLGTGPPGTAGDLQLRRPGGDRDIVSSGDGRFLSFITPFVMSWWDEIFVWLPLQPRIHREVLNEILDEVPDGTLSGSRNEQRRKIRHRIPPN